MCHVRNQRLIIDYYQNISYGSSHVCFAVKANTVLTEINVIKTIRLEQKLKSMRLTELLIPFGKLLNQYKGLEEYLESESIYPEQQLINTLDTISGSRENSLLQVIKRVSDMDLFSFHAHSKCPQLRIWNPLEESFASFTEQGRKKAMVWQDQYDPIDPDSIEKWLLKNSMRIVI